MTRKPIALEDRNQDGSKLFSPSAGRNKDVIADWLASQLPENAHVLELGSGTGEHGAALGERRSDVRWQYSDPDTASRASQAAWARPDWSAPLNLDAATENWWSSLPQFDAIFSANMIHIAPWQATLGLAEGARSCADQVIFYGPFLTGDTSDASNLAFDQSLKSRDPDWGVRELDRVKDIFAKNGFKHCKCFTMPKNNLIVRLSRRDMI